MAIDASRKPDYVLDLSVVFGGCPTMLRLCRIPVLLFALTIELAGPMPVLAQLPAYSEPQEFETYWTKKRRSQRKYIIWGVVGLIISAGAIFIFLNAIDRSQAHRAMRDKLLERERKGIA